MSRTCYSEIHLHITWHVKGNTPLLDEPTERIAHEAIRQKALETRGVVVRTIGGTATHVHLAVSVPPTVHISDFIGQLKGASSYTVNRNTTRAEPFAWQAGYGVVSFGTRALEWVIAYIDNQKAHHADGNTFDRLERVTPDEDTAPEIAELTAVVP